MLKLTLKNTYNKKFICKDIPKILIGVISNEIYSNIKISEYLKADCGLTVAEFVKILTKNIQILKIDDKYLELFFNTNSKVANNISLDKIIRTIDFGGSGLRGTSIFSNSFRYVQDRLYQLYMLSRMGGIK